MSQKEKIVASLIALPKKRNSVIDTKQKLKKEEEDLTLPSEPVTKLSPETEIIIF